MSSAATSKDGRTTNADERPSFSIASSALLTVTPARGAKATERSQADRMDAAELRTITPEEIQILAATGC
jgi:hypothetical protein